MALFHYWALNSLSRHFVSLCSSHWVGDSHTPYRSAFGSEGEGEVVVLHASGYIYKGCTYHCYTARKLFILATEKD